MSKNNSINFNGVSVNTGIIFRAIWKLAILKSVMTVRNVSVFFLPKQKQPLTNWSRQDFKAVKYSEQISGTVRHLKTEKVYESMGNNNQTVLDNRIKMGLNNHIDYLENISSMSPAQIVYAHILNQQIEWMKDVGDKVE